jgi:hypothetical protein
VLVLFGSCTTLLGAQDPIEIFVTPDGSVEGGRDAAADADAGDLPSYRSGSRLRARLVKADGVALFVGWHDQGPNDVDCSYGIADDGRMRCLPQGQDVSSLQGYFADPNCTMPIGVPSGCAPPRFVVGTVGMGATTTCDSSVWRMGTAMPPAGMIFQNFGGQPCVIASMQPSTVYPLTQIPAAQFVAATTTRRTRGSGLAMEWLEGEDGSLEASGLFDTKRNARCGPNALGSPDFGSLFPGRCVPNDVAWIIDLYSDPSCTMPAAWGVPASACMPAPTAVIDAPGQGSPWNGMGCSPPAPSLAEIGPPITSTIYGNNTGGSACAPTGIGSSAAFAVGAPIAPDALPALLPGDQGTGRIRLRTLTTAGGVPLFARTLFDSQLGAECAPTAVPDGTLRCVPSYPYVDLVYADPACTMALEQTTSGCTAPTHAQASNCTGSCSSCAEQVYQVGARQNVTTTYTSYGGSCTPQPASSSSDFYAAAPVPPSGFEPVQPVTE